MRFFKYLVALFVSIISINAYAETVYTIGYNAPGWNNDNKYSSASSACNSLISHLNSLYPESGYTVFKVEETRCTFRTKSGESYATIGKKEVENCPAIDYPMYVFFDAGTAVPQQRCKALSAGKFCKFVNKGNPIILNHQNNRQSVVLYNASTTPTTSCNELDDGQCDKSNPYGSCYQPPDDGCTRQKDGSIICPDETPPPQPDQGCDKGATYCKRPPQGCGEGYVTGSFNGEQLCVKKGPNTPPNPDKPNDCTGANCPKPDDGYDCPVGYYATTFNGSKICVKENPNNPTNPKDPTNNPNDPNSNGGNTGGNNGGNTGGENGGNNGGNTGNPDGGDGDGDGFCDKGGKSLCDSVEKIKDFLTGKPDEEDGNEDIPTTEISEQSLSLDVFKANSSKCPADKHINLQTPFGTISKTFSFQDMCNETAWFGYIVLILAYSYAVNIVLRA